MSRDRGSEADRAGEAAETAGGARAELQGPESMTGEGSDVARPGSQLGTRIHVAMQQGASLLGNGRHALSGSGGFQALLLSAGEAQQPPGWRTRPALSTVSPAPTPRLSFLWVLSELFGIPPTHGPRWVPCQRRHPAGLGRGRAVRNSAYRRHPVLVRLERCPFACRPVPNSCWRAAVKGLARAARTLTSVPSMASSPRLGASFQRSCPQVAAAYLDQL